MNLEKISPEFAQALVRVQGSIEGAKKGSVNPHLKNKYADLASCWDACREALQTNGIAVLQFPVDSPAGFVGIRNTLLFGATGELLTETFTVPIKDATNPQAYGSSLTYGRRYALCSSVGICPEDDDGNKAAQQASKAPAQRRQDSPNTASSPVTVSSYLSTFESKTTSDAMKAVFTEVKNSSLEEPHKTALLKKMADAIKARRAEETK